MKSIAAIAEQLGITPAILRSWQINLNMKIPKYGNDEPVFNERWQEFFQQVAQLRKEGQSFSKIRSALAAVIPPENSLPEPGSTSAPPATPPLRKEHAFQPQGVVPAVSTQVIRSDLSSDELLGIYGPPAEPTQSTLPLSSVAVSRSEKTLKPQEMPENLVLPTLVGDSRTGMGTLQQLQTHMHEAILQKDLQKMTHTYVQLVENYQALASRYSESTYLIGQMEEKNRSLEERLRQEEQAHSEKVKQLEAHLGSLKNMLEIQNHRLEQQGAALVTKGEIEQVEKQIKLLAVTMFKQQQQQAEMQQRKGFMARLRSLLFRQV